jgi:flagellar hook-associated protein 3 FlgL
MTELLSKSEDIDIAEKMMEFSMMSTVYQASLSTGAKILQPSLLDYIR